MRHISELLDNMLAKAQKIKDPFEQSFFVMVHLPYLQRFADVNKRTSRLVANIPLIQANLCPLTFIRKIIREIVQNPDRNTLDTLSLALENAADSA